MRTRLLAGALSCLVLAAALAAGEGTRLATASRPAPEGLALAADAAADRTAWLFDSTLGMPFAMVALPPGFSGEGNVAWNHMAPAPMHSMWVRFACPDRRVVVEFAAPIAIFHEAGDVAGAPLRHDAAGVLQTFVQPLLAAASPGAAIGGIAASPDSPLLVPTRLELAAAEKAFLAIGRPVRDARAEVAAFAAVSGELRTRFSAGVWSFLAGPPPAAPGLGDAAVGKWTGLLCVTAPAGREVAGAEVAALLDGIQINPAWLAEAARASASIVEWPYLDRAKVQAKWQAMNRSGAVVVGPAGESRPAGYAPLPPGGVPVPASGRYTYVNAVLDGCFFGVRTGPARVDAENAETLRLFP